MREHYKTFEAKNSIRHRFKELDELAVEYANKNIEREVKIPFFDAVSGNISLPNLRSKLTGEIEVELEELLGKALPFNIEGVKYPIQYKPNLESEKISGRKYSAKLELKKIYECSDSRSDVLGELFIGFEEVIDFDMMAAKAMEKIVDEMFERIPLHKDLLCRTAKYLIGIQKKEEENKPKERKKPFMDDQDIPLCITSELTDEPDTTKKESLAQIFERRQIQFMVGKKTSEDIMDDDGKTLFEKGRVIDENMIKYTKNTGKFFELTNKVELIDDEPLETET